MGTPTEVPVPRKVNVRFSAIALSFEILAVTRPSRETAHKSFILANEWPHKTAVGPFPPNPIPLRIGIGIEFESLAWEGRVPVMAPLTLWRRDPMARKYGEKAQKTVKEAMHKYKEGELKSGKSGKKVKSRKQAIAIGFSEARKKGAKVPAKKKSK
jgi:hypothetical protein